MLDEDTLTRAVTFRIGRDLYAVEVRAVERVVRYATPRRVPRLPEWVEGIVDVDGRVVPVVDLRRRLGVEAAVPNAQTRLLLVSFEDEWCAVVVDEVLDVRPLEAADVASPPALVSALGGALVRGTVRRGDQLVLVLEVQALFSAAERSALGPLRSLGEVAHA